MLMGFVVAAGDLYAKRDITFPPTGCDCCSPVLTAPNPQLTDTF